MVIPVSNRMKKTGDLITCTDCVADIGCDHAYTSMYLIEMKKARHVLAMDINQGPLDIAKKNIKQFGYEGSIETRLSNGMEKLQADEADALLIGGMGGVLIRDILSAGKALLPSMKQLVLQPQSEASLVRRFLHENGFMIQTEDMLVEEDKFYVIMRAVPGHESYATDLEYTYGKCLLTEKNAVLKQFLDKQYDKIEHILEKLRQEKSCQERTKNRMAELAKQQKEILQIKGAYFDE